MWTADAEGRANYFNTAFYDFTHSNFERCRGDGWISVIADGEQEAARALWHETIDRGHTFEADLPINNGEGETRWHKVRLVPVHSQSGQVMRWVGSATDIETHKRMVSELKKERDKAESALAVKSEFVANVSHELRTPMNGILGMVQVLLRTQELTPTVKEYTLTIKEAADALLGIINDLLDFSKAEAGKMELTDSEFDVISLLEGVGDILVPQSTNKGILLLTSIDAGVPRRMIGDPLRLRQILLNLAGNAVKFTDEGIVIIKARMVDDSQADLKTEAKEDGKINIEFSVSDSGIGINPALLDNLFEPFVQADGSSHRTATGTGLGLCICKRLVDLMHGSLNVDSVESQGSVFSFRVPLAPAPGSLSRETILIDAAKLPLDIFVLEPPSRHGFVICEKLRILDLQATPFATADALLEAMQERECAFVSDVDKPRKLAICVDDIRMTAASAQLTRTIRENTAIQSLPVIHFDGREPEEGLQLPYDYFINMPAHRDDMLDCLIDIGNAGATTPASVANVSPRVSSIRLAAISSENIDIEGLGGRQTKRVLVADDNKINLQVARLFLEALDLTVDVVDDGIAAVTAFKTASYDLVVLDCQMPMLDGFESCRIIKEIQSRKGRRIPVIAMTAHAIAGSKENCLARGFDDYLSKPIEPTVLEKIVRFWLGMSDIKISGSHKKFSPPSQAEIDERNSSIMSQLSDNANASTKGPRMAIDINLLKSRFNDKNIRALFQLFLESYMDEIDELSKLAIDANWSKVKDKAHAFKGACGTICATTIAGFLNDLEKSTLNTETDDNTKLAILEEIKMELAKAVDEVNTYMAS